MKWDFVRDLIALFFSAIAIVVSIWAICKSRNVEKKQEEFYGIKIVEHHHKEEDRRKADLYGEIRKTGRSLVLKNKGSATARNINVRFLIELVDEGIIIFDDENITNISELESGAHIEWTVHTKEGGIKEIPVLFTWDDDYGTGRTKKATIHIN